MERDHAALCKARAERDAPECLARRSEARATTGKMVSKKSSPRMEKFAGASTRTSCNAGDANADPETLMLALRSAGHLSARRKRQAAFRSQCNRAPPAALVNKMLASHFPKLYGDRQEVTHKGNQTSVLMVDAEKAGAASGRCDAEANDRASASADARGHRRAGSARNRRIRLRTAG